MLLMKEKNQRITVRILTQVSVPDPGLREGLGGAVESRAGHDLLRIPSGPEHARRHLRYVVHDLQQLGSSGKLLQWCVP